MHISRCKVKAQKSISQILINNEHKTHPYFYNDITLTGNSRVKRVVCVISLGSGGDLWLEESFISASLDVNHDVFLCKKGKKHVTTDSFDNVFVSVCQFTLF
jgi:hypothetical protein